MHEDVGVDGDDLTIEETLVVGAEAEVTAVALKELERGVIAEVKAVAAAGAVVEQEVGAGAGAKAGVVVGAGLVSVVAVTVAVHTAAVAVVMKDVGGNMSGRWI